MLIRLAPLGQQAQPGSGTERRGGCKGGSLRALQAFRQPYPRRAGDSERRQNNSFVAAAPSTAVSVAGFCLARPAELHGSEAKRISMSLLSSSRDEQDPRVGELWSSAYSVWV